MPISGQNNLPSQSNRGSHVLQTGAPTPSWTPCLGPARDESASNLCELLRLGSAWCSTLTWAKHEELQFSEYTECLKTTSVIPMERKGNSKRQKVVMEEEEVMKHEK